MTMNSSQLASAANQGAEQSAFMLISLLGYLWPAWTQAIPPLHFEMLSARNVWASFKLYCIRFIFGAIIYCCWVRVVLALILGTHHKLSGILKLFHFWICRFVTCGNLSAFYVLAFQSVIYQWVCLDAIQVCEHAHLNLASPTCFKMSH